MKEIDIQALSGNISKLNPAGNSVNKAKSADFAKILGDSLKEANKLQLQAGKAIQQLATGNKENIHGTMIAIEKAAVSFQLMMQIRNKIIDAYQDIMKTTM